jgi:hypothetical protein
MPSKKNWAVVRRLVGYDRLELPALPALERIHDLARDYVNFVHPVRKLVNKTRSGPRVTRRYDGAQTPFHRLLDSGRALNQDDQATERTLKKPRSIPTQSPARSRAAYARRSRRSVGFLREASMTPQSDPKVRHHAPNVANFAKSGRRKCPVASSQKPKTEFKTAPGEWVRLA